MENMPDNFHEGERRLLFQSLASFFKKKYAEKCRYVVAVKT